MTSPRSSASSRARHARRVEAGRRDDPRAVCRQRRRPPRAPRRSRRRSESTAARSPAAVDLNAVDTADGEKILGAHLRRAGAGGHAEADRVEPKTAGIDFGKLLPILAPIVMGLIANAEEGQDDDCGCRGRRRCRRLGLGDLIGGLLGGGAGSARRGSLCRRHRHRRPARWPAGRQEVASATSYADAASCSASP